MIEMKVRYVNVKLHLTIGDRDHVFIDKFLAYLRRTEYRDVLSVQSFTSRRRLEQHLKVEEPDILLVTSEMLSSIQSLTPPLTILLTETKQPPNDQSHDQIFKYQSLHQMCLTIMKIYSQHHQLFPQKTRAEKTQVISCYSATGGVGKTTCAINLARELTAMQHKVFYLNLEYFPSFATNLSDEDHFSRILYTIKSSPQQVPSKIDKHKSTHQFFHFDYFPPLRSSDEILDLDAQDSSVLIDSIIRFNYYDYVIIDLESSLHERVISALEQSDWVIWLLVDHPFDAEKTEALIRIMRSRPDLQGTKILSRTLYLLNKSLSGESKTAAHSYSPHVSSANVSISGELPYIPEWKSIKNIEEVVSSMNFRNELIKIFYQKMVDKGEQFK